MVARRYGIFHLMHSTVVQLMNSDGGSEFYQEKERHFMYNVCVTFLTVTIVQHPVWQCGQ